MRIHDLRIDATPKMARKVAVKRSLVAALICGETGFHLAGTQWPDSEKIGLALHIAEPRIRMVPGAGEVNNAFEVQASIEAARCQGSRAHFQVWNGMGRGELHAARDSRTLRKASDDAADILC